jgi:hypothetical protein
MNLTPTLYLYTKINLNVIIDQDVRGKIIPPWNWRARILSSSLDDGYMDYREEQNPDVQCFLKLI